ncbi:unnamed protein product [Spirodela intermedia]|uniref:Retrovirus-related Pol polyprotein from transposon TNT 1-94-like beta-barrel domain-containing protein n=1 Tax=Spirodela intermedia TaxID=51605 RepID=A0A7I8K9K5_SPIIN|nr:unnamed protein product [Spirodela intermedia]
MVIEETEVLLQGVSHTKYKNGMWYLDTCATSHMIGEKNLNFDLDQTYKGRVKFGDDSRIPIEGQGKILLNTKSGSKKESFNHGHGEIHLLLSHRDNSEFKSLSQLYSET